MSNIQIKQKSQLSCTYHLELINESGKVSDMGFYKNLITDFGLNSVEGISLPLNAVHLGIGVFNTALSEPRLTSWFKRQGFPGAQPTGDSGSPDYIAFAERTLTFGVGSITNQTISEIGIGAGVDNSELFSRAEISPPLFVGSNNQLRVTYRLEADPLVNQADIVAVITNDSDPLDIITFTSRVSDADSLQAVKGFDGDSIARLYSGGGFGSVINFPTGSIIATDSSTKTREAYIQDSFHVVYEFVWATNNGNGQVDYLLFSCNSHFVQINVNPPIQKTSESVLTIRFQWEWSR